MPQAGDIGWARTTGVMGRLIQFGTWLRFRRCDFNHQFAVDDRVDADGVPFIIQATMHGVTNTMRLDQVAGKRGRYVTMSPPPEVDRARFLEFLHRQVGVEYDLLTDLAIGIDTVTWQSFPAFRGARKPSWQCAALINEGLRWAGWWHDWIDIYSMFPEDGYLVLSSVASFVDASKS